MLKNMVALVTGSLNGLGAKTVERLLAEKACVVGCDLRKLRADQEGVYGEHYRFKNADVRSEDDMKSIVAHTIQEFGHLNIVVNCAGIAGAFRLVKTNQPKAVTFEDAWRVLEINVLGTFNVCRLAAEEMCKNEADEDGARGLIINTSGFLSSEGRSAQSFIAASHGGIDSMTLPLSRDLAPFGIRVNTISPGLFDTPLTQSLPKETRDCFERLSCHPNRFGYPDEYCDLVMHLIENKMINGEVLRLDAGLRIPSFF